MSLTDIQAVRLKSSTGVQLTREVAVATGTDLYFKLGNAPIATSSPPQVRQNGTLLVETIDYTVDYDFAVITLSLLPSVGDQFEFTYYWSIYSDDEVQFFLNDAGGNLTVAAAKLLLALAADAARLAKRQSQSGGGGAGQVTVDTSVAARELRAAAQALIQTEADLGNAIPAEGLTETPWTVWGLEDEIEQSLIRTGTALPGGG